MESLDDRHYNTSNRQMLAIIATVVAAGLLVLQIVLLAFFPWHQERVHGLWDSSMVWVLHPFIVWIPLWIVILAAIWWGVCRKHAPRRQFHALVLSVLLAVGVMVAGLLRTPPPSYRVAPSRELPSEIPSLPFHDIYR